jgi:hypothetical protein
MCFLKELNMSRRHSDEPMPLDEMFREQEIDRRMDEEEVLRPYRQIAEEVAHDEEFD